LSTADRFILPVKRIGYRGRASFPFKREEGMKILVSILAEMITQHYPPTIYMHPWMLPFKENQFGRILPMVVPAY
jgi:hypothetical protein